MSNLSAVIKPDIYISWIPTGKIGLKPQMFASIIPTPEKVSADTFRKVASTEKISGDTFRKVGQSDSAQADTYRVIKVSEKVIGDTSRKIGITTAHADTQRKLKNFVQVGVDTLRQIGTREKFSADTKRIVGETEIVAADSFRQVTVTEKVAADLVRRLREYVRADLHRKLTRREKFVASTVISVPHILIYNSKPKQRTLKAKKILKANSTEDTFKQYGVAAVNISLREKTLSDEFSIDITKNHMWISDLVKGSVNGFPFEFNVEESTQTESSIIQTVRGRYNIDEQLYTQFFLEETNDTKVDVEDWTAVDCIAAVAKYLDLKFIDMFDDFTPYHLYPNTTTTYADLLSSLFGWTSRLPHRQINVFVRDKYIYCVQRGKEGDKAVVDLDKFNHSALTINRKLVRSLWNKAQDEIEDYSPEDADDKGLPFSGTLRFTSKGCATELSFQGGLLQRESNEIETDKATIISSADYYYTSIETATRLEDDNNPIINIKHEYYLSKKIAVTDSITLEGDEDEDAENDTDRSRTTQNSTTVYSYGRTDDDIYLTNETEEIITTTYEIGQYGSWGPADKKTDIRQTFHVPLGNGFYAQSVYYNDEAQGSNISQGAPSNKVTPLTIKAAREALYCVGFDIENVKDTLNLEEATEEQYEDWRRKRASIDDISFPVKEPEILSALTSELEWLDRKTQENVTVDVYGDDVEIVDFDKRVSVGGNEYFLVSNQISLTPRQLVQKLNLVRWY